MATRTDELEASISDLMKQNEALREAVGQSDVDRTEELDNDNQLAELKVALAVAATENQAKSVELKSLSAAVEELTCEIDVNRVMLLLLLS